jgi:hypothetical protein
MTGLYAGIRDTGLTGVLTLFSQWLHLPDPDVVLTVLAVVVANRMSGDPVWLLVVGPSGGGKTEIIQAIGGLPDVTVAGVLTEASLLSGTPRKEKAAGARGGLLHDIGRFGIITLKDFGSILSMKHETRAGLLAALREVYDGDWTRHVGTDGGRTLHWSGKLGLVAGCTPVIDSHHGVMAALGERFALYRLTVEDDDAQAHASLDHHGQEEQMRAELRQAVAGLLDGLGSSEAVLPLSGADKDRLVALARIVVRCRSAVERDHYHREIDLVPASEAPGRLVGVLARILSACRVLGADDETAWRITQKVAFDSMPAQRLAVVLLLEGSATPMPVKAVAERLDLPTTTTRRVLEDLTAHHVLHRRRGKADEWELEPWIRELSRNLPYLYLHPHRTKEEFAGNHSLPRFQTGFEAGSGDEP